jgi:Rps23 Pro-64 3,4-dihydroxylase Tpa1-like proline 4-hydroxylase
MSLDRVAMLLVGGCAFTILKDAYDIGREGLAGSVYCKSMQVKNQLSLDKVSIQHLEKTGFVVVDNVLPADIIKSARIEAKQVLQRVMDPALNDKEVSTYRRDIFTSIDKERTKYYSALNQAREILSSTGRSIIDNSFSGFIGDMEKMKIEEKLMVPATVQLSIYGNKAFYKAHYDSAVELDYSRGLIAYLKEYAYRKRFVTAILYLNDEWSSEEHDKSGYLRLYTNSSGNVDVKPQGGRMIIFDSKRVLHEVLPCDATKKRIAITCWFTL